MIIVFLTLFTSFHCSLFEATLYSTRMAALEAAATDETEKRKQGLARRLIQMKHKISEPIASILVLNTVANTAGATLAGLYAEHLLDAIQVPLFAIGLTLAILFFAEILPKMLGVVHWRGLWPSIVWPLTVMKYALYPVIIVTQKFAQVLTGARIPPAITEDEILAQVRLGVQAGEISDRESLMVHNIIRLEDRVIREIMTPRTVMFSLDSRMTVQEAIKAAAEKGFTRIPVYERDGENVVGYVMMHDLSLASVLSTPQARLKSLAKPISFVPETVNCLKLLTTFLRQRMQIAIVVDEYGGITGLVTMEDLLETVLGAEIVDERDRVVDLQEAARKKGLRPPKI
jgi:CBS domain containing-hemolysin-like protein